MTRRTPNAPDGLGPRGRRFWRSMHADYDYSDAETELLVEACRVLDNVEALAAVVAAEGPTSTGSKGQTVTHPALQELRQQRLLLSRLLPQLEDVDAEVSGPALASAASVRGRKAAAARWGA
jgi:hypothetical protein